ncbi:DNA-binding transcriptional LysR family regulator [Phyllobacterium trifolii]|uniref:DNA-binding transcriptional LysR family regulator n=1 Tax=Phyllobacterium trifolii TaxID=300193 RepID=A0A839UJ15_9HYPH|nr:LysR family transcriptional regulator [Phyllobacterium trifolii]MBB3148529.1 DNA-binding transcriptional LysR family regulator [Phyllobacterium trifolii]
MNVPKQNIPPIHDVDIRLLRIFKSVVECGGLSAAEYTLGVGRSAISKHLSDLEARLMVRLCERGRSGFSITPYGETVYRATIELLDALDQFRAQVSAAKGVLTGAADLCLMDNLHLERGNPVATALKKFSQRSHGVTLNVSTAGPGEAEEAVSARLANVAVTSSNSGLPGLTYKALAVHRSALYAATSHRLASIRPGTALSEIDDLDIVTRAYQRREHSLLGLGWRSSAVANDQEATVQLILSGQFVGVLTEHTADPWVQNGKMVRVPVEQPFIETSTYVVFRTKSKNLPVVQAIAQDLANAYAGASKANAA